nr:MAG TPA: hypothetical protein [Caudoviricetes sp.]
MQNRQPRRRQLPRRQAPSASYSSQLGRCKALRIGRIR